MPPFDHLQGDAPATGVTPSGIAFDRVATSGVPVVLIHAGIADRRMWDPQWPHLTSARSTVRLDLRAHAPDHLALTGDLANVSLTAEWRSALAWIDGCGLVDGGSQPLVLDAMMGE